MKLTFDVFLWVKNVVTECIHLAIICVSGSDGWFIRLYTFFITITITKAKKANKKKVKKKNEIPIYTNISNFWHGHGFIQQQQQQQTNK